MSELAIYGAGGPAQQLVVWADALQAAATIADVIVQTGTCPEAFRGRPQEATAAIVFGAELGMSPVAALRSLYVIHGQIGMYVRAQVALAQKHGHRIWTVRESDLSVTVAGHRGDDPSHVEEVTWTIERAKRAGLYREGDVRSQYARQPRTMLWSRAAGDVARRIAADALSGIAETDEPTEPADAPTSGPGASGWVQVQRPATQPRQIDDVELPAIVEDPEGGPPPPQEPTRSDDEPAETLPIEDPPDYADETPEPLLTTGQRNKIQATFHELGVHTAEQRHTHESAWLARTVENTNDLTVTEASHVIDQLERWKATRNV